MIKDFFIKLRRVLSPQVTLNELRATTTYEDIEAAEGIIKTILQNTQPVVPEKTLKERMEEAIELSTKTKSDIAAAINRSQQRKKLEEEADAAWDRIIREYTERTAQSGTLHNNPPQKQQTMKEMTQGGQIASAGLAFSPSGTSLHSTLTVSTGAPEVWSSPELLETHVLEESIELVYLQRRTYSISPWVATERCFKIVYSVVDGKWNKSEPIDGQIIPASGVTYQFD